MRKKDQSGPVVAPFHHRHKLPWFKSRHIWLFGTLMLYLLIVPLIEQIMPKSKSILDLFIVFVLVAAAYTVIDRKRTFFIALFLFVAGLVLLMGEFYWQTKRALIAGSVCYVGFMAIVIFAIVKEVLTQKEVSFDTIAGALNGYLLMGLMWGFAYQAVEASWSGSFHIPAQLLETVRSSLYAYDLPALFYFSFVTITTTGYGDITPLTPIAGQLAITESVVGQFYMVVLVARLVSLHTMKSKS
ncbi:potassium channel family protein [Desulfoferula mesophila]|uniref:Potassium channel domain-containing protein n=1 Tax=Desulfoferula mesophila TaxID=3058419 RepID=A0AAU9ECP0_9BACT|nr:hypothetical protein FAK_19090 [Desulfoferula mesophilus]